MQNYDSHPAINGEIARYINFPSIAQRRQLRLIAESRAGDYVLSENQAARMGNALNETHSIIKSAAYDISASARMIQRCDDSPEEELSARLLTRSAVRRYSESMLRVSAISEAARTRLLKISRTSSDLTDEDVIDEISQIASMAARLPDLLACALKSKKRENILNPLRELSARVALIISDYREEDSNDD